MGVRGQLNSEGVNDMAKLSADEQVAITNGYDEGERVQRAGGKAQYINPHLWSSRLWEAFEFGYYLQEKGRPLRSYERGRGNVYRTVDGFEFKLHYGKGKNSFGISRIN
jgi:hypothetical protein